MLWKSAFFRRCIQEIFYFLPKVEIIRFFFLSAVLYSSATEVDRRQKESVVIGRQSNVVETSASESKSLWRERERKKKVPPTRVT